MAISLAGLLGGAVHSIETAGSNALSFATSTASNMTNNVVKTAQTIENTIQNDFTTVPALIKNVLPASATTQPVPLPYTVHSIQNMSIPSNNNTVAPIIPRSTVTTPTTPIITQPFATSWPFSSPRVTTPTSTFSPVYAISKSSTSTANPGTTDAEVKGAIAQLNSLYPGNTGYVVDPLTGNTIDLADADLNELVQTIQDKQNANAYAQPLNTYSPQNVSSGNTAVTLSDLSGLVKSHPYLTAAAGAALGALGTSILTRTHRRSHTGRRRIRRLRSSKGRRSHPRYRSKAWMAHIRKMRHRR